MSSSLNYSLNRIRPVSHKCGSSRFGSFLVLFRSFLISVKRGASVSIRYLIETDNPLDTDRFHRVSIRYKHVSSEQKAINAFTHARFSFGFNLIASGCILFCCSFSLQMSGYNQHLNRLNTFPHKCNLTLKAVL